MPITHRQKKHRIVSKKFRKTLNSIRSNIYFRQSNRNSDKETLLHMYTHVIRKCSNPSIHYRCGKYYQATLLQSPEIDPGFRDFETSVLFTRGYTLHMLHEVFQRAGTFFLNTGVGEDIQNRPFWNAWYVANKVYTPAFMKYKSCFPF